jgi:hypothetical protein
MKNFLRIAQGVDVMPLLMALHRNPQWWKEDTYLRSYPQGPFGEIDSIILRFPPRSVAETEEKLQELLTDPHYDPHECVDQPIYAQIPEARGLVMALFGRVGGVRLGRVIINRVMPGGRIFKHADRPEHANYWHRHHLCLQSAPGALISAGDEQVYMAPGEFWWFNNGREVDGEIPEHEVFNNSSVERIHLILDARI